MITLVEKTQIGRNVYQVDIGYQILRFCSIFNVEIRTKNL